MLCNTVKTFKSSFLKGTVIKSKATVSYMLCYHVDHQRFGQNHHIFKVENSARHSSHKLNHMVRTEAITDHKWDQLQN